MAQKYHRGDVVFVGTMSDEEGMGHFPGDQEAIVMGSYADQYGGGPSCEDHYTLLFTGSGGESSWYYDHHLTFIRHGGESEIEAVHAKRAGQDAHDANLDWIVSNWNSIRERPPMASLFALAALSGYSPDDLWGKHGEGIDLWSNTTQIHRAFDPVLLGGDIEAVKAFAPTVKIKLFDNDFNA